MDSRSFPWIQMAQLHHTWQLRITSRRACIPSMVLSFKAMARRTGLFPASWDTNATRFLAQTWTRGWKTKVYRCTLTAGRALPHKLGEEESCSDMASVLRTCQYWNQTERAVCWAVPMWLGTDTQFGWSAKASHGTGNFRKHFLNQLKREEFRPMSDNLKPPWNNLTGAALESSFVPVWKTWKVSTENLSFR